MTDQPMDPKRLERMRAGDLNVAAALAMIPELIRSHDEGYRLATRHEDLRRQAEAVCECRTAELVAARAGTEAPSLLTEINGLRAKIDELEDTLAATLENWEAYAAELDPAPTKDHECLDRYLKCLECDEIEPHRWQPSPDAGPGWRCSICGEITIDDTPIPPPAPDEWSSADLEAFDIEPGGEL